MQAAKAGGAPPDTGLGGRAGSRPIPARPQLRAPQKRWMRVQASSSTAFDVA